MPKATTPKCIEKERKYKALFISKNIIKIFVTC
jgi:hypothetical protein